MESSNNIKEYIDKSGYKYKWVAEKVGCFPSDISHYIAGNRMPNRGRLKKLSHILKCRMKDLYPDLSFYVSCRNKGEQDE
jgi:transcriptional regulator with XRE-family HTH domain